MIETNREENMVVIARDGTGTPTIWCDPEIADIVTALNSAGISTVASCSGHGRRPGIISLADGREIILPRGEADSRVINEAFPLDINGDATPAPTVDETERLRLTDAVRSGVHEFLVRDINAPHWFGREKREKLVSRICAALSDRPQAEGEVNRG